MEDLYIYTGSFVVIGASIGGPAVGSLIAGDRSIPILLMAIGGAGMLATAGYDLLRTDPEKFTTSAIVLLVSLFSRLAEPGALVPLARQKRVCMKTVLPSARGYQNLRNLG
ncbi:hypothetical protein PM023_17645 [Halorubrum ezzemoulense]|uniref:hypothetical protein n=1 Tax=Halorubrum ezzemoulense TaxID=337243 RepID=UPI00232E5A9A|nr:hypothetical protein [Halorubrum ezzemoulense]MDB2226438.1 hypothetical protein [Halorubrum ezzemoulense]